MKTRSFKTARELVAFVNDVANAVATTVAIVFDASSNTFVLFYE